MTPSSTYSPFSHKTILITGGTGSFGKAFAKFLVEENQCKKIIIFSRDEWKQWEMQKSHPLFSHSKMRYFLGDVRDIQRLMRAFSEVDIVVHAAALKHVPVAEYNPSEFIKTNINGAMNVINAALDCGVKNVIALSTDKAVNPVNLYGATKLCSDKLFTAANAYVGSRGYPKFSVVRYGNVAFSRGSIIPYWKNLIASGEKTLPLTDERMTRFWITLDQAVQCVKNCLMNMQGGEIFVPKIPSVRIVDLAEALAPGMPRRICGIRPGEKIDELLISSDESRHTLAFDNHFIIMPQGRFSEEVQFVGKGARALEENFTYTSGNNTDWLSIEEIRDQIQILSKPV